MNKLIKIAGITIAAATMSPVALAADDAKQEEGKPSFNEFTANVTLATEYRYRGIAQTNSRPAIQGGFDYANKNGLYVGAWGSNVSWISDQGGNDASASLELDLYGGYKFSYGDFSFDVGGLQYWYPGKYTSGWDKNYSSPDTFELYVAGTWQWFTLKYSYALTDLFGNKDSKGAQYVDLAGTYEIGSGWNLIGHVGYQYVPSSTSLGRESGDLSYVDWKLGVTKEVLPGTTVGLAYIDTNAKTVSSGRPFNYTNVYNNDLGKATALLWVTKAF